MRSGFVLLNLIFFASSGTWQVEGWQPKLHLTHTATKTVLKAGKDAVPESQTKTSRASTSSFVSPPVFLSQAFNSECDNVNRPPSLNILLRSLDQLAPTKPNSKSDIRGTFVNHARLGSLASVAHEIASHSSPSLIGGQPPLTPFAAHCLGYAFAKYLLEQKQQNRGYLPQGTSSEEQDDGSLIILMGQDPRSHGRTLLDAMARGAESVDPNGLVKVVYTGIATTPACAALCKPPLSACDAAVMVTASHLPADRNGFKFYMNPDFVQEDGGNLIQALGIRAADCASEWYNRGILPPFSGHAAVMCSAWVDFMPLYANHLKQAIQREVSDVKVDSDRPLEGLKIVLNAGNGSGGFFEAVLRELGADTSGSLHLEPDSSFPNGIPNPESSSMVETTTRACEEVSADLGIMLDTDADRCGFIVPRYNNGVASYEPLNRNRLIALLGVVFARSSPNCAVVTDSVTSEGLATFLEDDLGLVHVRYLKGYANVINKAKQLTRAYEEGISKMNAEFAIETSGHCAMKENGFLDDGTYTAVKIVSLLARERLLQDGSNTAGSLLDLISNLQEMDHVQELRMSVKDGSLDTMGQVFDLCALAMEEHAADDASNVSWTLDRDNLEGIRFRFGGDDSGQFFMLRQSLHDPLLSLQVEGKSQDAIRHEVMMPLVKLFESEERIVETLDFTVLSK